MSLTGASTPLGIPNFGGTDRPTLHTSPGLPDITSAVDTLIGTRVVRLADVTLAAPAAAINFTSIPQTYAHLKIVLEGVSDAAGTYVSLIMRLNGNTGANYYWQESYASAAVLTAAEAIGQTYGLVGRIPVSSATPPTSAVEIVIPYYAGTALVKSWRSTWGLAHNNGSGTLRVGDIFGYFNQAAAISSISLFALTGNLVGSRATLYGMP